MIDARSSFDPNNAGIVGRRCSRRRPSECCVLQVSDLSTLHPFDLSHYQRQTLQ